VVGLRRARRAEPRVGTWNGRVRLFGLGGPKKVSFCHFGKVEQLWGLRALNRSDVWTRDSDCDRW
jgi:hypothetical protein